jgi:hypothetical protein
MSFIDDLPQPDVIVVINRGSLTVIQPWCSNSPRS